MANEDQGWPFTFLLVLILNSIIICTDIFVKDVVNNLRILDFSHERLTFHGQSRELLY